ncbi:hypothetical protein [Leptospira adleri]|uniref:Uncharacterized protein n=1 Tax=Leptospira adleri TaxID=2023186 RepID=A0A2M9YIZ9_9LEPT|nr:hypothetical protein [Leptospira adleri]PJZ51519.1 hypothetical protein CH380_19730 [Leptospira adleri]PJZ61573.1 hypothetical protein CH376_12355 [Leptospira adleri]
MPNPQSDSDKVEKKRERIDIGLPPKSFAIEVHLPGSSSNIFFPVEYVTTIKSHRSISAQRGGISLTIPYQESYFVQRNTETPLPLSQIKEGEFLRFRDIFPVRSIVFIYYDNGSGNSKESSFNKLNVGKVKSTSREYSAEGKSFVSVTISPIETLLSDTDFFIDYQRTEGVPPTRTQESYAGVITKATKVFLQGQLSDLIKNFWDEFFCSLMNVSRYADHPVLSPTSQNDPDSILTILLPKKAYTEFFTYESQVLSSFSIGSYVNFWEILRSYVSEPLYELFVDPLQSFQIDGLFGKGVSLGEIGSNVIEEYEVGRKEAKVVFRPTPFYMFGKDGKYRDLKTSNIDACYYFAFDDLKNYRIEDSEDSVIAGVHVIQSTFQQFGTVLSEPKYEDKLRSIFGPKLLHVKMAGLVFKEENLNEKNKENYKSELAKIRDRLFSIFCDIEELKIASGSFDLPFIPLRPGIPYRIEMDSSKKYPMPDDEISEFGYITDVIDEFSPGQAKANTTISFKWSPTSSRAYTD